MQGEEQGWIKLHRKLNNASFKNRPLVMALFIHLLLNVNIRSTKFYWNNEEIELLPGQLITGRFKLSKLSGLSQQETRTALYFLKSTSTITIKTTNKFSIITILNWGNYQQRATKRSTSSATNEQPTSNQQLTTYKEYKNVKNEKNINIYAEVENYDKPITFEKNSKVDIKKIVSTLEKEEHISHDYQYYGLEIWETLEAPQNKKSEFIRIVRDYPTKAVMSAYSFARDYPVRAIRWKMFFKHLAQHLPK